MMTETITYPRPVSRAAMQVFEKDDPIFARLLVENGRVKVIDQQISVDGKNGNNSKT
jgi:hypothetical protein